MCISLSIVATILQTYHARRSIESAAKLLTVELMWFSCFAIFLPHIVVGKLRVCKIPETNFLGRHKKMFPEDFQKQRHHEDVILRDKVYFLHIRLLPETSSCQQKKKVFVSKCHITQANVSCPKHCNVLCRCLILRRNSIEWIQWRKWHRIERENPNVRNGLAMLHRHTAWHMCATYQIVFTRPSARV